MADEVAPRAVPPANAVGTARVLTLVFTDLVDSTGAQGAPRRPRRGRGRSRAITTWCVASPATRRSRGRQRRRRLLPHLRHPERRGRLRARACSTAHRADAELPPVRVGIHLGEVTERPAPPGSSKPHPGRRSRGRSRRAHPVARAPGPGAALARRLRRRPAATARRRSRSRDRVARLRPLPLQGVGRRRSRSARRESPASRRSRRRPIPTRRGARSPPATS